MSNGELIQFDKKLTPEDILGLDLSEELIGHKTKEKDEK